ncbi:MAG: hypothetical protein HY645_11150 [Acidobacteria bacterium]|nr:hypothetical protein [Acidobacteriota bacterium]
MKALALNSSRANRLWHLVVVADGQLIAGAEFKSQVGSFGNNYNNRVPK